MVFPQAQQAPAGDFLGGVFSSALHLPSLKGKIFRPSCWDRLTAMGHPSSFLWLGQPWGKLHLHSHPVQSMALETKRDCESLISVFSCSQI